MRVIASLAFSLLALSWWPASAGAQHGQMVRVRGKGVPHLGSSGRGDQIVYLDVVVPRTLTKDQRRLYGQLRDLEGPTSQDGDNQDFFGRFKDAMGGS